MIQGARDPATIQWKRSGIPPIEVLALLAGAGRAMEQAGDDRDVRGRTLGNILDGLRPTPQREDRR